MALPTATEARDHLEGYEISSSILSDAWIDDERDNNIVPYVNSYIGTDISTEQETTEYCSGVGTSLLSLSRRNINELVSIMLVRGEDIIASIALTSVDLISDEGIIKAKTNLSEGQYFSIFPKGDRNIKITYKHGGSLPNDLKHAVKKLMCVAMLKEISSRTGGGSLSTQGWSRDYGKRGKYSNIMMEFHRDATVILNRYKTSVVGS